MTKKEFLETPLYEVYMLFEHHQYEKQLERYYQVCDAMARIM